MEASSLTPQAEALERACQIAGSQTALAEKLGRTKAAISRWKTEQVPAEICPEIESLTGVRCEELRPDVSWGVLRSKKARAA
jgi:DNA-binding transcriptional regulator YdaS (Cro superfamily)